MSALDDYHRVRLLDPCQASHAASETDENNQVGRPDNTTLAEKLHHNSTLADKLHANITFADMGIPRSTPLQDTMVGKARPASDLSLIEKLYLTLTTSFLFVTVIISGYRLTVTDYQSPQFSLGIVLLINAAFSLGFVLEAVLRERVSELLILVLTSLGTLVVLVISFLRNPTEKSSLAHLILASAFCPLLVILGLRLTWTYLISRKLVFRTVGASERMQCAFLLLVTLQDLLKFDLQLWVSMTVFTTLEADELDTLDISLMAVGAVATFVWVCLGLTAISRESKLGSGLFFFLCPFQVAYVIYKLYETSKAGYSGGKTTTPTVASEIIALVVRIITVTFGFTVAGNFNKGLKEILHGRQSQQDTQESVAQNVDEIY